MLRIVKTPESANISQLVYNTETQTLEVTFTNGGIYLYFKVPGETWDTLHQAESKGQYFAAHVRGVYKFEKVKGAD